MALTLAILVLLSGCFSEPVPTQAHPSCSWTTQPPSDADTVCREIFQTLKSIVNAEVHGDPRTIRQLVTNHAVADRIVAYGASIRAQGVKELHVVPSFTLGSVSGELTGAGFYLLGTTRSGGLKAREQIYLRIRTGVARIVKDQPAQEW